MDWWYVFGAAGSIFATYPIWRQITHKIEVKDGTPAEAMAYAMLNLVDKHYARVHAPSSAQESPYFSDESQRRRVLSDILSESVRYAIHNGHEVDREEFFHNFSMCMKSLSLLSGKIMTDCVIHKKRKKLQALEAQYVSLFAKQLVSNAPMMRQYSEDRMYMLCHYVVSKFIDQAIQRIKKLRK